MAKTKYTPNPIYPPPPAPATPPKWTTSAASTTIITVANAGSANPGTGLCQWARFLTTQSDTTGDVSAVNCVDSYKRYSWDQLEGAQGDYSAGFALIDADIAKATARGGKHAIGVYCLWDQHGLKVPNYIAQQGTGYYMTFASANDTYVPDWNDPFTLSRMDALLTALGQRYDGKLWWLQIGLYGDFGEWHTSTFPKNGPQGQADITLANKLALVDMHFNHFPNTRILSQTSDNDAAAYALAKSSAVGMVRQSLGDPNWLDLDPLNATGSNHNGCTMVAYNDASSHLVTTYRDTLRLAGGAKYNINSVWDGTSTFFQLALAVGIGGQFPVKAIDCGTANAAGNRYLHMRLMTNGVAAPSYSAKITQAGIGASAHATLSGGNISAVIVDQPGSGYLNGSSGTVPVTFGKVGTDSGSSAATAVAHVTNGAVTAIDTIVMNASTYATAPTVKIVDPGTVLTVSLTGVGGQPVSTSYTDYNIPLWASDGTGFGITTAVCNLINLIPVQRGAGATSGEGFYISELYLCATPDGAPTTLLYDNQAGMLAGAWASYGKDRWKTAPFWAEYFGTSGGGTVFDGSGAATVLTLNGSPVDTSTTFRLIVDGVFTAPITYSATAPTLVSNVTAALSTALGATAAAAFTVAANTSGTPTITLSSYAVVPIKAVYTNLSATIGVATTMNGANSQISNYHVSCVGNGNMTYSTLTTQQKADWDNIGTGAEWPGAGDLSPAGYQYHVTAISMSAKVYSGYATGISAYWRNIGAAPDYEGLVATWQLLDSGTLVWSMPCGTPLSSLPVVAGGTSGGVVHTIDAFTMPTTLPNHTLTLQLVVTDPGRPGFAVTIPNILTLTPF